MYGVFTYIYHRNQPSVGKYIPYMDPVGLRNKCDILARKYISIRSLFNIRMICSPTTIKTSHRKVGLLTLVPFASCKKVLGLQDSYFHPVTWEHDHHFCWCFIFWMGLKPISWRSVDRHFRPLVKRTWIGGMFWQGDDLEVSSTLG